MDLSLDPYCSFLTNVSHLQLIVSFFSMLKTQLW